MSMPAAAAAFGDPANELARLLPFGDDRLAETGHENDLALIGGVRQTTNHHRTGLAELITQILSSTLKTAAIHTVKTLNQQLKLTDSNRLRGQGR